jgi:hypothetical protein
MKLAFAISSGRQVAPSSQHRAGRRSDGQRPALTSKQGACLSAARIPGTAEPAVQVSVDDCSWLVCVEVLSDEHSVPTGRFLRRALGAAIATAPKVALVTARPQRVYGPGYPAGWPGCTGPIRYGRIISLSSCSTMWQCQTNWPGLVNLSRSLVTWPG